LQGCEREVGEGMSLVICEVCDRLLNTDLDVECLNEFDEVVCKLCRDNRDEAAYERQQEKIMEDGGVDDTTYRRDMKLAGRGHLLK
jgi:hypothetical protein